jgi:dynein heavy chain
VKWKNREPNTSPLGRNGHSLTQFNGKFLLFGGIANGLEDPNLKKVSPINDMWTFEIYPKNTYGWSKLSPKGNIPTPRANHSATTVKKGGRDDFIFIFGGTGEEGKLNDCYRYDHSEQKFTKYEIEENTCPAPRSGHSTVCHNGKVYLFGGNGGRGYENSIFKDLWCFDPEAKKWEEILYKNENPTYPELRTSQSMFVFNNELYVYGGWNTIAAFSTAIKYNFESNEWTSANMQLENFSVWNHCGILVESGPGWKYFIFGGSSKEFDETKLRERADCTNSMYYCDMEDEDLKPVKLNDVEPGETQLMPEPREDAAMIYYQNSKNLFLFGGWNNQWFNDVYSICVSAIVGPSYSVKSLEPPMGRISGNEEVRLFGSKLAAGNITVYFILGSKYAQTTAEWISDTELKFLTPVFSEPSFINPNNRFQGTKDCDVYIKIDNEELSTNPMRFSIYYDTDASKSIFFGPACLNGGTAGEPICFMIRARNDENENRLSGLDKFECTVVSESDMTKSVPTEVTDLKNGTYMVKFTVPKSEEPDAAPEK